MTGILTMAPDDDERERVARATRGDHGAIEELLVRHLPGLEAFLRRRAGAALLRRESGGDLAQSVCREVLLQLRAGAFEYQGEAAFRNWLYQAALFKLRERREYHGAAKRSIARDDSASVGSQAAAEGPTPSQRVAAAEQADSIARALERLPPDLRRVVELAKFDGRSHAEIAAELGISEVNSRKLLSRALARLTSLRAKGSP